MSISNPSPPVLVVISFFPIHQTVKLRQGSLKIGCLVSSRRAGRKEKNLATLRVITSAGSLIGFRRKSGQFEGLVRKQFKTE